ncbi:MAG: CHAD domain-containing protein [Gammaproteobacteria bacterium]
MANTSIHFVLQGHLTTEALIAALSDRFNIQLVSQNYAIKTFYDSFDWRLYSGEILCELNQSKSTSRLILTDSHSDNILASAVLDKVPAFSWEFQNKKIRKIVSPLLEMRALLPITTLDYTLYKLNILNKDEKTVLRINIETYDLIPSRVSLEPVKGYDKVLTRVCKLLSQLELKQTQDSVLVDSLKTQGRKPKDYSSKLKIELAPEIRADVAVKFIFSHLLKTIKVNEQGAIADIDSEFLHDFRVAVRRTRSGLSQLKGVLPESKTAQFSQYFAWLGQLTNLTRDMDVYLIQFDAYKNSLPVSLRGDLDPLHDFLSEKQKQAHKSLASKLKSSEYVAPLIEWEEYLKTPAIKQPIEPHAGKPIKALADCRIWKVYRRVIKQGDRITEESPAQDLHNLRKTCKKLRYLMEFFQSLYPETKIKPLIKSLKDFQEILGDYQDLEIQEQTLKSFSQEMRENQISTNTFLAMGVLIQNLDNRRCQARKAFTSKFETFKQSKNQNAFEALFKS